MIGRMLAILATLVVLAGTAEVQARSDEAIKRNNFGVELLKQDRLAEAAEEFRRAVELEPDYAPTRLNLAYIYDRQGRIEEAITEYRKAITLEPTNLLAHNNLGVLYDKQSRYEEAMGEFQEALKIDPSDATALKNLENAKRNRGIVQEREERLGQARKEVQAHPDNPRASYNLARLYATFDEKDQAVEWLSRALELGFNDFTLLKHDPALESLKGDPRYMRFLEGR